MRRVFREEYEVSPIGFNAIKIKKEADEELNKLIAENEQRNKDKVDERFKLNLLKKKKFLRAKREKEVLERIEEETLLELDRRLDHKTEQAAIKTKEVLLFIVSLKIILQRFLFKINNY
jgi:hypothetical protein